MSRRSFALPLLRLLLLPLALPPSACAWESVPSGLRPSHEAPVLPTPTDDGRGDAATAAVGFSPRALARGRGVDWLSAPPSTAVSGITTTMWSNLRLRPNAPTTELKSPPGLGEGPLPPRAVKLALGLVARRGLLPTLLLAPVPEPPFRLRVPWRVEPPPNLSLLLRPSTSP